jgi:cell division septal protein FtsQ
MNVRDVEKTSLQQTQNSKRSRRRKRGRSGYVLLVLLFTGALIGILSVTVFFNIKTIRVTGNADSYTAEDVVRATGISVGDNMIRLKIKNAEKRAVDALVHVETVEIKREFPNTLEIKVQKCTPAYNVVYEFGTLIVSEQGRILDNSMDPLPGLVRIVGYTPHETALGKYISAEEERCDKVFSAFRDLIYNGDLAAPIVEVDMSDFNDIMVNFDHRILFDMGNWSEINYKISFAEQIISSQPADKEGYLTMIGTNQLSFRNKADYESTRRAAKDAAKRKPAETSATENETSASGSEEETEETQDQTGLGGLDDVYGEAG